MTSAQAPASAKPPAEPVLGTASVIDGDIIEVHGQRIRLSGIDAPESRQLCQDASGKDYRCGQKAALALADKIGRQTIRCVGKATDRYGRLVAVCYLKELDLGAWLVSEGLAIDYRKYSLDYLDEEDRAREQRKGLWQGQFVEPWEWRRAKR
jgi:Micrococcal nuclease (thermonuclease) homologs